MKENVNITPLFPTLVYSRENLFNNNWLRETIETMESIELPSQRLETELGTVTVKQVNPESYFGDTNHKLDHKIDTSWLFETVKESMLDFMSEMNIPLERYDIYIQKWWPVITRDGGTVSRHTHHNAHFSAVYYLSVEDGSAQDPGCLCFYSNPDYWSRRVGFGCDDRGGVDTFVQYLPKAGDLVIFPANLEHAVSENSYSSKRMSISMDIMLILKDREDDVSDELAIPPITTWTKL